MHVHPVMQAVYRQVSWHGCQSKLSLALKPPASKCRPLLSREVPMVRWRHVRLIVPSVQISHKALHKCLSLSAGPSTAYHHLLLFLLHGFQLAMALVVYAVLAHARPAATGKLRLNTPCTCIGPDYICCRTGGGRELAQASSHAVRCPYSPCPRGNDWYCESQFNPAYGRCNTGSRFPNARCAYSDQCLTGY